MNTIIYYLMLTSLLFVLVICSGMSINYANNNDQTDLQSTITATLVFLLLSLCAFIYAFYQNRDSKVKYIIFILLMCLGMIISQLIYITQGTLSMLTPFMIGNAIILPLIFVSFILLYFNFIKNKLR